MKNINQIIILSVSLFFVLSCKDEKEDAFHKIQVNINNAQHINLSELADTIRFIKLNTPKDIQVSQITMIKSEGNFLVIRNSANPPSLIVFNNNGEFVSEIKRHGKGPGEYSLISSFFIDHKSKQVELIDRLSRKKLTYTLYDEFIEESLDLKWAGDCIIKHDNNYIVHYGNLKTVSDHMVNIYDGTYTKKASYLKIPNNYYDFFHIINPFNFSKFKSEVLFWHALSSYIYAIDQDGLHIKYEIDFGKHNIPSEKFSLQYDDVGSFMQGIWENDYAYLSGAAGEGDRYLFLRGSQGRNSFFHLFYDKKSNTPLVVSGYYDDILFDQVWELDISEISAVLYEDNKLYFVIDAYQMNQIINYEDDSTTQKIYSDIFLSNTIGDIAINDNPFIIELSLKK